MAKPIEFEEATHILGAGDNIDTNDLPICRTKRIVERGVEQVEVPQTISKWELTDEEIEEIKRTRCIWFGAQGMTHPPVWISGLYPFIQEET